MPSDLLDLNELDRLCKAAVAGPWHMLHNEPSPRCDCAQVWTNDWCVAHCDTQSDGEGFRRDVQMHNAAYIVAANPEAVGKLIAALREFAEYMLVDIDESKIITLYRETCEKHGIDPASVEERP